MSNTNIDDKAKYDGKWRVLKEYGLHNDKAKTSFLTEVKRLRALQVKNFDSEKILFQLKAAFSASMHC